MTLKAPFIVDNYYNSYPASSITTIIDKELKVYHLTFIYTLYVNNLVHYNNSADYKILS